MRIRRKTAVLLTIAMIVCSTAGMIYADDAGEPDILQFAEEMAEEDDSVTGIVSEEDDYDSVSDSGPAEISGVPEDPDDGADTADGGSPAVSDSSFVPDLTEDPSAETEPDTGEFPEAGDLADTTEIPEQPDDRTVTEISGEPFFSESFLAELPDDRDALLKGYLDAFLFPSVRKRSTDAAGRYGLYGRNLLIYNRLRESVADVAAGNSFSTQFALSGEELQLPDAGWTAEDLGVEAIVRDGSITYEAMEAAVAMLQIDRDLILSALCVDCPFDLYWFDKDQSVQMQGPQCTAAGSDGEWVLRFTGGITFTFPVSPEYAADTYLVDGETTAAISGAINTVDSIVSSCAGLGDPEKLEAYRAEICALADYDHDAVYRHEVSGNMRQLIWVFDGDPSTRVVCEGYAKAFQYLCDLSTFASPLVSSRIVYGDMGDGEYGEAHMWNVVTMDDGGSYLADVTNCDAGAVGEDRELFLAGVPENEAAGSARNGYTFYPNGQIIRYDYDPDMFLLYSEEELTLSAGSYAGPGETPACVVSVGAEFSDLVIYQSQNHTENLKKIAAVLPEKVTVTCDNGVSCALPVSGNWELDEQNHCYVNSVPESGLPENAADRDHLLDRITIGYTISDAPRDSLNVLQFPDPAFAGRSGTVRVYLAAAAADTSWVFRITENADGTCSGEKWLDSEISGEFDEEASAEFAPYHVYQIPSLRPEDSGEYVSVYFNGTSGGTAFVSTEIAVLNVLKLDLSGAEVTNVTDKTYTGKPVTQNPSVMLEGAALEKDKDYTLSFRDNISVGTAQLVLTGKGNYTGSRTVPFRIRFADVTDPSAFYYDSIYWALDEGITTGFADGTFRPLNSCNRASVVTFLWRLAGCPEPGTIASFSDMTGNAVFDKAISWASETGITTGWADNTFRPWNTCNRAAIITFLWRFAGEPYTDISGLNPFMDIPESNAFYPAILWGVQNGLVTGWSDATFRPWNTCNRLAIVTFLYRFANPEARAGGQEDGMFSLADPYPAASASKNTITVRWNQTAGAAQYRVYWRLPGGEWKNCAVTGGTSTVISGLKYNTGYEITVRAFGSSGENSIYHAITCQTEKQILDTPQVTAAADKNSITVKWKAVSGASRYRVEYRKTGEAWTVSGEVSGTSRTISGLSYYTDYEIRVRAAGENEAESPYCTVTCRTAAQVLNTPQVTATAYRNTITVTWNSVPGASRFRVDYRKSGGTWTLNEGPYGTSFKITGLAYDTAYEIRVKAFGTNQAASAYASKTCRTQVESYILNKSSKKIHYATCSAVERMSEKNKLVSYGKTLAQLKAEGYTPCQICF